MCRMTMPGESRVTVYHTVYCPLRGRKPLRLASRLRPGPARVRSRLQKLSSVHAQVGGGPVGPGQSLPAAARTALTLRRRGQAPPAHLGEQEAGWGRGREPGPNPCPARGLGRRSRLCGPRGRAGAGRGVPRVTAPPGTPRPPAPTPAPPHSRSPPPHPPRLPRTPTPLPRILPAPPHPSLSRPPARARHPCSPAACAPPARRGQAL